MKFPTYKLTRIPLWMCFFKIFKRRKKKKITNEARISSRIFEGNNNFSFISYQKYQIFVFIYKLVLINAMKCVIRIIHGVKVKIIIIN